MPKKEIKKQEPEKLSALPAACVKYFNSVESKF